jgi:hypothetical protein
MMLFDSVAGSASRFFVSTIEIQEISTHKAGGMGDKPFINAFHVEAMIALWQNSSSLLPQIRPSKSDSP